MESKKKQRPDGSRHSQKMARRIGMAMGAHLFLALGSAQAVAATPEFIPGNPGDLVLRGLVPGDPVPGDLGLGDLGLGGVAPGGVAPGVSIDVGGPVLLGPVSDGDAPGGIISGDLALGSFLAGGPVGVSTFSAPPSGGGLTNAAFYTTIAHSNLPEVSVGDRIKLGGDIVFSAYDEVNSGSQDGGDYLSLEFNSGGDSFMKSTPGFDDSYASHFNVWYHDNYQLTQAVIDEAGMSGSISPGRYDLVEVNADFNAVFQDDQLVSGYEASVGLVLDPGFLSIDQLDDSEAYRSVFDAAFSSGQVQLAHGGIYTPNGSAEGLQIDQVLESSQNVSQGASFDNVGQGLDASFAVGAPADPDLEILATELPFDLGLDYVTADTGEDFVPIVLADIRPYRTGGVVHHLDSPIYFGLFYDDTGMTLAQERALQIFHFDEAIQGWEVIDSTVDTDENIISFYASDFSPYGAGYSSVPEPSVLAFLLGGWGFLLARRRLA